MFKQSPWTLPRLTFCPRVFPHHRSSELTIEQILARCKQTGQRFRDLDFRGDESALYLDPMMPSSMCSSGHRHDPHCLFFCHSFRVAIIPSHPALFFVVILSTGRESTMPWCLVCLMLRLFPSLLLKLPQMRFLLLVGGGLPPIFVGPTPANLYVS